MTRRLLKRLSRGTRQADGFTIVELMLAMTIFSVILVGASAGIIYVGRMYYKSVITTRAQDNTRLVIDDISRSVQFSGQEPEIQSSGQQTQICFGRTRYTVLVAESADDASSVYRQQIPSGPCSQAVPDDEGVELLSENMNLTRFNIEQIGQSDTYRVLVWLAYGDDSDLFSSDSNDSDRWICNPSGFGVEFCAISELSTIVSRRVF